VLATTLCVSLVDLLQLRNFALLLRPSTKAARTSPSGNVVVLSTAFSVQAPHAAALLDLPVAALSAKASTTCQCLPNPRTFSRPATAAGR